KRSKKDTFAFFLPERRAHPTSFFWIASFQPRYCVKISSVIYIVIESEKVSIYNFTMQGK
ncbi:hypothetical protein, partial [Aneurinibacillus migulanus]|uniref:hypothetical protein n=1 Tax=Aneurinibacillus migulanus TaxID=47500 RepID=UPI001C3F830A